MYKLSSYSFYLPYKERIIYFNGISSVIFSMKKKEHQQVQALFNDLISFEINYNTVFKKFLMCGFIVEIEKDEIDILRYKNRMEVFSNRKYKLVINPTLECNFKCWYCYEKHPQGYMSSEVMEKCKKHILYMVEHEKITSLILDWFGGEPILYFDEIIYPIGEYA